MRRREPTKDKHIHGAKAFRGPRHARETARRSDVRSPEHRELRTVLQLTAVPDNTKPDRFLQRLKNSAIDRVLEESVRRLKAGRCSRPRRPRPWRSRKANHSTHCTRKTPCGAAPAMSRAAHPEAAHQGRSSRVRIRGEMRPQSRDAFKHSEPKTTRSSR